VAAKDTLAAAIGDGLKPPLSAAKFRKKALCFQRRLGDTVQVVDVQLSAGNTAGAVRFYVNVGVAFPALWALEDDADDDPWRAHECHFQQRLEDLVDAPKWWTVDAGTDRAVLAARLRAVAEALLARLDRVRSPRAAIDVLLADADSELRARLRYVEGDDDGALADLRATARRFADRRGMKVADLVERHGLARLAERL
jgi:hypothetical protein